MRYAFHNHLSTIIQMQIEQPQPEYVLEVEKLLSSEVATTCWARNMDLLALITLDHILQVYRISFKAQRVFKLEQDQPISAMCFSDNSQLLAFRLENGLIRLIKTENGEKVVLVDDQPSTDVNSLSYLHFCQLSHSFSQLKKKHMHFSSQKLRQVIMALCSNAIVKINYFNELQNDFYILLAAERRHTLVLINGFIPFARIDYNLPYSQFNVLHAYYNGTFQSLVAQELMDGYSLLLVEHHLNKSANSAQVVMLKQDTTKMNCLISYVSEIIKFLEKSYVVAEGYIRDIMRQYNSKINLIDEGNANKQENINPCEELFKYLNCGITSQSLLNFFSKEVHDSKILQKLDQTLNTVFAQLHDLLLESIQNSLEKATLLLHELKKLAKIDRFKRLGLQLQSLEAASQQIIRLYTMGEILLVQSTQAKFDIRNLLVWLNKATVKTAVENEADIENSKSYLSRYSVQFNRLYNFLQNESVFRLSNLADFFSTSLEAKPMPIKRPDFNLFPMAPDFNQTQAVFQCNAQQQLQLKLELNNLPFPQKTSMNIEHSYRTFKFQIGQLQSMWKKISLKPFETVSSLISSNFVSTQIGFAQSSEFFPFQVKHTIKDNIMLVHYVQRHSDHDRLIQYDCKKKTKSYLKSTKNHIVSFTASNQIICVLENKSSSKRIICGIVNEKFDGGEMLIGHTINKVEGEVSVNSGMRGLNSLIIDKNKLVIFTQGDQ